MRKMKASLLAGTVWSGRYGVRQLGEPGDGVNEGLRPSMMSYCFASSESVPLYELAYEDAWDPFDSKGMGGTVVIERNA